jgi:hypothetical protein
MRARSRSTRGVLVPVALLVGLLGACSHGGSNRGSSSPPSTESASASASRSTRLLRIGSIDLQRAGTKGTIDKGTKRAILAIAQAYVDRAILAPLETGNLARSYSALFVPGIRQAVTGADRGTLTDLSVGKTTTFSEQATPVALSALVDQSGALLYAATKFNVKVQATKAGGAVTINRNVELTVELDHGRWLVVAYRISVTRTAPHRQASPRPTTTTTRRTRPRTTTTVRHRKP